jgi:hypothetical protein
MEKLRISVASSILGGLGGNSCQSDITSKNLSSRIFIMNRECGYALGTKLHIRKIRALHVETRPE